MLELVRRAVGSEVLLSEGEAQRYALGATTPIVVAPRHRDQAAALLHAAAREGWSVLCAGAGTTINRGNVRYQPDLIVTTARLTAITGYEPADLVLTAQAGVPLAAIAQATLAHKQFLALDPAVSDAATIGGMVATAVAGPLRFAHGTPRDHVLGLELIAGDGRVLHFGGKVVKNVAGYDIVRPLVGSRGTLGMMTEISVRLKPLPESDQTVLIEVGTFEAGADMAAAVVAAHLDVVALEIVSPALMRELGASSWSVMVRLHGNSEAVADSIVQLRTLGTSSQTRTADASAWKGLRLKEHEARWVVRLANLPARLHETGAAAAHFAQRAFGDSGSMIVHAGDGIVRLLSEHASGEFEEAVRHTLAIMNHVGGTLIIERAARPVDDRPPNIDGLALMAGVKRVFDPAGIFAAGSLAV